MTAVGTFKKGMTGAPTFHFGVIEQGVSCTWSGGFETCPDNCPRPRKPREKTSGQTAGCTLP